jgi:exodeoxyribonuclease V alpha subunit
LDLEQDAAKNKTSFCDFVTQTGYLPPCYWSINVFGETTCDVFDHHPFGDISSYENRFKRVPALKWGLTPYTGSTWYFRLGMSDSDDERYFPPSILANNTKNYLNTIKPQRSIVFLYANYSNPVSGNDYKYAIVGVGLAKETPHFPPDYSIPSDVMQSVRAPKGMEYFPELAWQFQFKIDPHTAFLLPYHEYLEKIYSYPEDQRDDKWKELNDIAVKVDERSIIQNFKYVSRSVTNDKAIYLLYVIKQKIEKMKNHSTINYKVIDDMETKVNNLLKTAWTERGRYPGFKSFLTVLLRNNVKSKSVINLIEDIVVEEFGSLQNYFEKKPAVDLIKKTGALLRAFQIIFDNFNKVEFFSQFDFSEKQFSRCMDLLKTEDFNEITKNPYCLLEKYYYKHENDEVDIEDNDFGIALYNFDIALIPDLEIADWSTNYFAESIERMRAVVRQILIDEASDNGSSCLFRSEILDRIEKYPLYYINEQFKFELNRLIEYESSQTFKDVFLVNSVIGKDDVTYQLKPIRKMENIIEQFIESCLKTTYTISPNTKAEIEQIVQEEERRHGSRLISKERYQLYNGVLSNKFYIISGKAGSGKTSAVINLIAKFTKDNHFPIFIFTPTGKANLVIKQRLAERGLKIGPKLKVSTIHRFLFTALFETQDQAIFKNAFSLKEKVERILDNRLELISEFAEHAKQLSFNPRIVIIDESSMVDERLLSLLFAMLNSDSIKHLIFVGDERQLPPIGLGKPFVDSIFYLRNKGFDNKLTRLESSLRFDIDSSLGMFAEQFGREEVPLADEIDETLKVDDKFFKVFYYTEDGIKEKLKEIVNTIHCTPSASLFKCFADTFESEPELNLNKLQLITPRRVGYFGSDDLNLRQILDGNARIRPQTKLICEENIYHNIFHNGRWIRILGLANGSIGYVTKENDVYFDDIADLEQEYGPDAIKFLKSKIKSELYSSLKIERKINFGYSITIHKAQGSDFEHVLLVLPEKSSFVTKELLYTAVTRAEKKLILLTSETLKEELSEILAKACENSVLAQRKTLLFGYKLSAFKPYYYKKRSGETIAVRSKIELLIAKALDFNNVDYVYEPQDFYQEYRIWPDFKLSIEGKNYYIEHLGDMSHRPYRERWEKKWQVYKNRLQIGDIVITTEEKDGYIDKGIQAIVNDIKNGKLVASKGSYSSHHYIL